LERCADWPRPPGATGHWLTCQVSFGGWVDRVLVLVNDSVFAFPYLFLAIVMAFLPLGSVGGGAVMAAVAITVVHLVVMGPPGKRAAGPANDKLCQQTCRAIRVGACHYSIH